MEMHTLDGEEEPVADTTACWTMATSTLFSVGENRSVLVNLGCSHKNSTD